MNACCDKFHDFLITCITEINVFAKLEPNTDYTWIITDKFGSKYSGEFTTDDYGFWIIDVNDLPEGMLTQYAGAFTLEVQDSGCKPIKFKVAQEYNQIEFEVRSGTLDKNTLGCSF